jgi:excinuclease ABC subunit A
MSTNLVRTDSHLDSLDPKEYIIIKRARVNNLKNLSVAIPRNKLVVITGLSGSGKSSLAFDTLFAEGQRMYVESLSSYARQFLGRMEKPDVDYIRGVSPAIAIEQKVNTRNPRSTVGTSTEIYDYLKLLFARIGRTYSPISGKEVKRDTVTDVVNAVNKLPTGTRIMIAAPITIQKGRKIQDELNLLLSKGFARVLLNGEVAFIEELLNSKKKLTDKDKVEILIDRTAVNADDEDTIFRISDSVQTAFYEGHDECLIHAEGQKPMHFSDRFELDGMTFTEPSVNFFSFNNPFGACRTCEGFGKVLGIDDDLVVPDKSLSVYEGAIAPWRSEAMSEWAKPLLKKWYQVQLPDSSALQRVERKRKGLALERKLVFRRHSCIL